MSEVKRKDVFADIAGTRDTHQPQPRSVRREPLVEPQPWLFQQLENNSRGKHSDILSLEGLDPTAVFQPLDKVDTPEKLARELERMRERYAPFMQDLAPVPTPTRNMLPLTSFDWRIQTEADQADFMRALSGQGEWERVDIPYYGGPLGRATTLYRTTFEVTAELQTYGTLFLCFKGVDYKVHAFVNGHYVGSHEGFFAPFAFECTTAARLGGNVLLLSVENDAICMGNNSWGEDGHLYEGDKLYAATGPGYNDPLVGWHHCPPGMGIYQAVTLEARAPLFIDDIFVRPMLENGEREARAEAWIQVHNTGRLRQELSLELSLYGQNFAQTIFEGQGYEVSGPAGPAVNEYRLAFEIPAPRLWNTETPWLYQLQVRLLDADGKTLDVQRRQFGLRAFRMEEADEPKGRFYLNDAEIRLRGANTMGHMQQCVIHADWEQLRDDILLAKLCHMNFFRLTQRPVQPEIYEYCDRLGMMTQTDLPLFAVLRRNQFCEAVRQAGEMEQLVRSHPCNVLISYINEPFPNAHNKPHRHLLRAELEAFFLAADQVVHLLNPDRVIKPVDGDYDPPAPGLPDNHCYCGWYNGHGVDLGKLHAGYWQKVKPGWNYGCGEFGAEGLDPVNVMRDHYPPAWLPQTPEEEYAWTPDRIVQAQTGRFHYMWFDTQHTLADWVAASQAHQARMTRLMTEAFRRDARMTSFAIHLFIDAFPSGWMKAIMDVERQPKPAYFAYREALTPLMVNLRSDRRAFFAGERLALSLPKELALSLPKGATVEAWLCNDLDVLPEHTSLVYQLELDGEIVAAQRNPAKVVRCGSAFQGFVDFRVPDVVRRSEMVVRLALLYGDETVLHDTALSFDVFPSIAPAPVRACVIGAPHSEAQRLAAELGVETIPLDAVRPGDVMLLSECEPSRLDCDLNEIIARVAQGATAVFLGLPPGEYTLSEECIQVQPCGMNPRHFCSRATGHPLVADLKPNDFWFWYDAAAGYVTPFLPSTFTAPGWTPILTSGNGDWSGGWGPALAAAEKPHGRGLLRICQVSLADRTRHNPVARLFANRLLREC